MDLGWGIQVRVTGSLLTSSSISCVVESTLLVAESDEAFPGSDEEVEGGSNLYVILTFFAFRHMGSVECVTVHVLSNHARGGGCHFCAASCAGTSFA